MVQMDPWRRTATPARQMTLETTTITSMAASPASAWLTNGSLTDAFQAHNQALMMRRSQTMVATLT